jgi:hypothetical protein
MVIFYATGSNHSPLFATLHQGQLSYPYSTRELVNLIRHLQHYPKDSLLQILENVFSFDIFNPQLREHLAQTFHRYICPRRWQRGDSRSTIC